jgi:hypothetical protein
MKTTTRNLKYLAWIRTLPCIVCGRTAGIEAAHTGPHGMAQKSADSSAVPLCVGHHRTGRDSYHKLGSRGFERHHHLDLHGIVARLNAKPSIRIGLRAFVGRYAAEDYVLGPIEIGLRAAVRQMLTIKRKVEYFGLLHGKEIDKDPASGRVFACDSQQNQCCSGVALTRVGIPS